MSSNPTSRRYCNPLYDGYFADPFVFRAEGRYYAVGTAPRTRRRASRVFPLLESEDFVTWREAGHALVPLDETFGDSYWAPEVTWADGRYYLYYSVGHGDRGHQLRVAASSGPEGPYRDLGKTLLSPETCSFAIDPHPFLDDDGRRYLFYARDFLDSEPEDGRSVRVRAGTALVVRELVDMTRLGERSAVVLRARYDWQRFQSHRPMYGRTFDWHTLEGPFLQKYEGRYYCLYSGGCWQTNGYGVDFAVADSIWGPYSDEGAASGPRILRAVPGSVLGPGHNSVVEGPDGTGAFIAYHAWDCDMQKRRMFLDPLQWTPDGPRCDGPSRQPRALAHRTA